MVDLIPGTSLPIQEPSAAPQPEGRGAIGLRSERAPVSMLEDVERPEDMPEGQRTIVDAALQYFNRKRHVRVEYLLSTGVTDGTTGNLIVQLFEVPQGKQGHICNVTFDAPGQTTLTPSAPFSNAASYSFIAVGSPSSGNQIPQTTANTQALRRGMVAFAPTSSAGPFLPGQWTFNDSNAPVAFGGQAIFLVIVGGSQAGISGLSLVIRTRINLEDRE